MTIPKTEISEQHVQWLQHYLRSAAPSGNEIRGQRIWLDLIKQWVDNYWVDPYGNVVALINEEAKFKVVLEAHADEIAWYIHRVTKDGFLHVEKNGGSDPGIAPSQKVLIHTETGTVSGIFGWPAVHARPNAMHPKEETLFVDCGCKSAEDVSALGIQIGDCVTYDSHLSVMNGDYFVGRGQDNKMGGFILAMVASMIHESQVKPPFGVYFVNSVQEEVGLHGAGMVANIIKPNCAIVTDVTHATRTPMMDKNKQGDIDLGRGPVITKAPPVHNKLRELLVNIARDENVPYQLAVSSKKTGTDTDAFAYTGKGIPSALLSLPLRYMHTTVETTHRADIENVMKMLYAFLMRMRPDFDFKYFS